MAVYRPKYRDPNPEEQNNAKLPVDSPADERKQTVSRLSESVAKMIRRLNTLISETTSPKIRAQATKELKKYEALGKKYTALGKRPPKR